MQYILSEEKYNRLKKYEKYCIKNIDGNPSYYEELFNLKVKLGRCERTLESRTDENFRLEEEVWKLRDNLRKLCKKKWYQFVELKID